MRKKNSIRNERKNIKNIKYINLTFETYKIKFIVDANKMKF